MLLSIVIATSNSEKYLSRCLASIVDEKSDEVEIVIVDNASTDATLKLINNFSDSVDVLITEPDEGQSDAFNKGFEIASGEYLTWLNSDDFYLPGALSNLLRVIRKKQAKWYTFDTIFIDEESRIKRMYRGERWLKYFDKNTGAQVNAPSSIFHREIYQRSKKFDTTLFYSMDVELWLQFILNGEKWIRINEYSYVFQMHSFSKTSSDGFSPPDEKKRAESLRTISKYGIVPLGLYKKTLIYLNKITGRWVLGVVDTKINYNRTLKSWMSKKNEWR